MKPADLATLAICSSSMSPTKPAIAAAGAAAGIASGAGAAASGVAAAAAPPSAAGTAGAEGCAAADGVAAGVTGGALEAELPPIWATVVSAGNVAASEA